MNQWWGLITKALCEIEFFILVIYIFGGGFQPWCWADYFGKMCCAISSANTWLEKLKILYLCLLILVVYYLTEDASTPKSVS